MDQIKDDDVGTVWRRKGGTDHVVINAISPNGNLSIRLLDAGGAPVPPREPSIFTAQSFLSYFDRTALKKECPYCSRLIEPGGHK